jgi:hypothetical protein
MTHLSGLQVGLRRAEIFEQRADAKNGFPRAVWFRQEGCCHISGTGGLCVAGSEDDMNAGVMLRNPAGETDSIHRVGASHKIDVAEDKINDRSRGEDGNSFRRISCFDDIVASYPQKLGSDTAPRISSSTTKTTRCRSSLPGAAFGLMIRKTYGKHSTTLIRQQP